MASYKITANGIEMGIYQGETQAEALDAYARDAGYADYSALVLELAADGSYRDEHERQAAIERIEAECTITRIR